MPRLGVNIDHVATLRQARKTTYPSPLQAAQEVVEAGADQVTLHLREDRRHVQDQDLINIRNSLKIKLNLEMAATEEMVGIALNSRPNLVTLVPEKRLELTTEGGLNLKENFLSLKDSVQALQEDGVPVSLFINPDLEDVKRSQDLGALGIELHTGSYAEASSPEVAQKEIQRIREASRFGSELKLKVFAGHGLHYENILPLVPILEIEEYNIGHSIIARAVFVGLKEAVREMKILLEGKGAKGH